LWAVAAMSAMAISGVGATVPVANVAHQRPLPLHSQILLQFYFDYLLLLQCFDAVGWAAERASSL